MNTTDLWESLGSLGDHQTSQVLMQMFARYEQRREQNPTDPEAQSFFQALSVCIDQVQSCNVSRR